MPGKSKHGKGKHPHNKKSKIRQRQAATSMSQPAAGNAPKTAMPIRASASPAPKAATPSAASTIYQRDYTLSEIKRIGILTGIIFVILIILYFVLP